MKSQLEAAVDTEPRLEMQNHHTHTRDHAHAHANAPIHRPIPRRTLNTAHLDTAQHTETAQTQTQTHPNASLPTSRSSDFLAQLNARLLRANTYASPPDTQNSPTSPSSTLPRQNKSFTSLARASTLQGVYDDVTESQSVVSTPWGNGAETPAHGVMGLNMPQHPLASGAATRQPTKATHMSLRRRRSSHAPHARKTRIARYAVQAAKIAALAVFGICYGLLVRYLHETRQLAAVFRVRRGEVRGARWGGVDVLVWGLAGVVLGCALPAVDGVWRERSERGVGQKKGCTDKDRSGEVEGEKEGAVENGDADIDIDIDIDSPVSEQINDVVRSVAAFVGIAFAIRRLPWQSTLQLTLTLALVNPALWYILDRSKPGLSFSLLVTSLLTGVVFLGVPGALAVSRGLGTAGAGVGGAGAGAGADKAGFLGQGGWDNLAVVTWVGSVLFCSCVCFGNVGRRLAVLEGGWRRAS